MRKPTTPGEILNEEFLKPMELTQRELAEHIGMETKAINRLVNGGNLSPLMAVKLARAFKTSTSFWLNLQVKVDAYEAECLLKKEKINIKPIAI